MKIIFTFSLLIVVLFFGCAPSFKIVQVSDKFSDPKEPYGFMGLNNRLSTKSSSGGLHIDSKGVYVEPYVYRDRKTNDIASVGFVVAHYNFSVSSGFRPIQEIVFLTNSGGRVALQMKALDPNISVGSWITISTEFHTEFSEISTCTISKEDFALLANARSLEAKITGGKLSQTYDKEDISSSFIANLKMFYEKQMK
jgi:hypothetical protein